MDGCNTNITHSVSESQEFLTFHSSVVPDTYSLRLNYEDPFLRPLIEQIDMDKRGDMTLVPKLGHHTIAFGNDERIEEKFRYLRIFYKEALPYHGWEKYSEISLKYAGQVVGIRKGERARIPVIPVDTLSN